MPTRIVTFKAEEDLVEKLDHLAKKLGGTRSDIIRMALMNYLREIQDVPKEGKAKKSLAIIKIV